jgi:hypothetical protein
VPQPAVSVPPPARCIDSAPDDASAQHEAAPFGSATYSKEELCAEIRSAFFCGEAGISPVVIENQAAYLAGWLSKLREDRKLLVYAAPEAQKAADFTLNRTLVRSAWLIRKRMTRNPLSYSLRCDIGGRESGSASYLFGGLWGPILLA